MKEKTADIDILEEKEKEAIKDLEEYLHWEELQGFSMLPRDKHIETLLNLVSTLIAENKELKERNKWKPIKEYNRQKYDWVLVKYFDGDYECVPEVAEQRIDGKWYTSEKQIPFEVKYFFDIQSLLGKE